MDFDTDFTFGIKHITVTTNDCNLGLFGDFSECKKFWFFINSKTRGNIDQTARNDFLGRPLNTSLGQSPDCSISVHKAL